jgi:hypothetical protein
VEGGVGKHPWADHATRPGEPPLGKVVFRNFAVLRLAATTFRVQGSGFRVQGSGFKVQGSGFRVQGSGFRVQGSGSRVQGSWFMFGSRLVDPTVTQNTTSEDRLRA